VDIHDTGGLNPEPARSPRPAAGRRLTGLQRLGQLEGEIIPAWLRPTDGENRLPAAAAIVVAVLLQLTVPNKYGLHPRWLLPALELVLLAVLTALNPVRLTRATPVGKYASLLVAPSSPWTTRSAPRSWITTSSPARPARTPPVCSPAALRST